MAEIQTIDGMPQRRLECRTWSHAWKHLRSVVLEDEAEGFVELQLVCTRCTTKRLDLVHWNSGLMERRRYVYPTGYQMADTVRQFETRQRFNGALRRELIGRLIENR